MEIVKSKWTKFTKKDRTTFPPRYGKYQVKFADGKPQLRTWNGTGWAYNHNDVVSWAKLDTIKR